MVRTTWFLLHTLSTHRGGVKKDVEDIETFLGMADLSTTCRLVWQPSWCFIGCVVQWGDLQPMCSIVTKASEASWSYSCDSKVSFDRVQILTPDFSGRSHPPSPPPPHLPSPPPCLPPSSLPPSLLPLRKFDSVRLRPVVALWHAVSVASLAAALSHSHSHSHSHCLSLSLISLISLSSLSHLSLISLSSLSSLPHLFLISLSSLSLSSLSLSLFSVSRLSVSLLSSLSSLAGGSGQRATYKGLFTWNRLPRPTCARRPAFCYSVQTRCYQSLFGFEMYL